MSPTPDEKALRLAREAEGYFDLGLHEDALARVEKLVDDERFTAFAAGMRAECLRNLGQFTEGAAAFEAIIAAEPSNVSAYVGLGWCRKRDGRLDLALESMERLLEVLPEEGIGLYNLACYCSLDGQRERAITLLSSAITGDVEFRELARKESDFDPIREDAGFRRIVMEEAP